MKPVEYKNILISGAGEIGSRHLQSMVHCRLPLHVYLQSNNLKSLEVCQQRWLEAGGGSSPHRLMICHDLGCLPQQIDLVVASSTASARLTLIEKIMTHARVSYWLIEKVLAQSGRDIESMLAKVSSGAKSWVNYYMRADPWYAEIKRHLIPGAPKYMRIYGGDWGLACNSLHFIHLHAWFTESNMASLNSEKLSSEWHASKRTGNWELFGELVVEFDDGGSVNLLSRAGPAEYSLSLQDGPHTWQIDEPAGIARRSDGLEIKGRVPYQSERKLVEQILTHGDCQLPTFDEVAVLDRAFVDTMLNHWQKYRDPAALRVPIT